MIDNDEQLAIPFTQLRGPKSAIEALVNVKGGMLAYGWTTSPETDGEYGKYNQVTAAWEWGISATEIKLSRLGTTVTRDLQTMQNVVHSAGWVSGGGITDNGDGTIDVAAGVGLIRATNDSTSELFFCDWDADTLSLTDNAENWIYVEYNAGDPILAVNTSEPANNNQYIKLAKIYRIGTELHINNTVRFTVGDHAGLMMQSMSEVMPFAWVSGADIAEVGTIQFDISAGVWWNGLTRFLTAHFDGTVDTFNMYYYSGAAWVEVTGETDINNTQYNNIASGLATLTANRYGVHWGYIATDNNVHTVLGQGDYTLAQAQAALSPTTIPPELMTDSRLLFKIIIQKSAAVFTSLESAIITPFQSGSAGTYTDEEAQDAAAALFTPDDGDIDFTYDDATPKITAVIKNTAVNLAKMADVATATVFYRKSALTGVPEVQTLATLITDIRVTLDTVYAALAGLATQVFSVAPATALAHAVRADQIQKQSVVAYTTGGTDTAYTLTTLAAPVALTTNEKWSVTFHATAGDTPPITLNRDGLGAKSLKYYNSAGAKTAVSPTVIIAGMVSDVVYDGTDYVVLDIAERLTVAQATDLTDGGQTTLHSHAGLTVAETNTNDIYRVGNSPGGVSAFTALIASKSGNDVVYKAPITGTEAALVVNSTSQLAKMRLYNTTRGTSMLISQSVVATKTITLTAAVPAAWVADDTITIVSQTVTGGSIDWVDLEITSGPIGKTALFLKLLINSATTGHFIFFHPFEAYGASKVVSVASLLASTSVSMMFLCKITSNVFSIAWSGTPAVIIVDELGYLP